LRGKLRVYLGAAPGVGKTYRMLEEGRSRAGRGADVVVALVEAHGRERTLDLARDLPAVPPRIVGGAGPDDSARPELDLDALLARRPQIALIDELAHTNLPGGRHAKRWQDVQTVLDAGIDVITTVNVEHLESLNDVVHRITGIPQRETVPDDVVRAADQIELVDMSPEALRRRLAHGDVYAAEQVDAALGNYFRAGNLAALRELALLWVADLVDEGLRQYRLAHNIDRVWEARERVVVALPGGAAGQPLIRRAARIARNSRGGRSGGGELLAVHIARSGALPDGTSPTALAAQRHLVESLGGSYHTVIGEDVAGALIEFAQAKNATQLVLGTSRRGRLGRFLTGRGVGETAVIRSGDIDVHLVAYEEPSESADDGLDPLGLELDDYGPPPPGQESLRLRSQPPGSRHSESQRPGSQRSRLQHSGSRHTDSAESASGRRTGREPSRRHGAAAAALVPPALTALLAHIPHGLNLTSQVLLFLVAVVAIARLGGMLSALAAAIWASLLLNYYFISPIHSTSIADANNAIALGVFIVVALTVASVVDLAANQSRRAAHAAAEAETLNALAVAVLRGDEAIPALLERFRETFAMASVAFLQRTARDGRPLPDENDDPSRWSVIATTGADPATAPGQADSTVAAGPDAVLALRGRALPAADQRVLSAFAAQATAALERRGLAHAAAQAANLEAADKMRTALLAAVSHDLRTPLSAARAAVSTLIDPELEVGPTDRAELLEVADESLDRLTRLVENLLDLSRLQAGALKPRLEPTAADEIVPRAIDDVPGAGGRVRLERVEPGVPAMLADGPLLERVIANLIGNAVQHTDSPIVITLSALAGSVELRCIDRGPGIPAAHRDLVFRPFQRLGDRDNSTGVGLGLALARGLVEAMGGTLTPEETPGGGVTMVVALPAAVV
jgi:two-component system, OmpR family, sensor histidine kinase KdpD